MKKKKKIILISSIVLFLMIAILIAYSFLASNKRPKSLSDVKTVKDAILYYNCKYIKTKKSKEDGYEKDIYMIFEKNPIQENGTSNKILYESIINLITKKSDYKKFRILDEEKNLTIKIERYQNDKVSYTINNTKNYFEYVQSAYSINNEKKDNITQTNIVSQELQNIINNDWIRKKTNLGEKTSSIDNYDVYWDRGYKVRTINNKIYNVIFTKQYQGEVLQRITTNMENEEISNILGEPTYKADEEIEVIGYRLENMYIFFSQGEISIYRPDEYSEEDNRNFAKLFTKLNEDKDYNSFLSELTAIYPDYSVYQQEDKYINIKYPLRGFEINFGNYVKNGITIYNNYKGSITEDISIDDVKNNKTLPANTYLNLEKNLVFEEEKNRAIYDSIKRIPYDDYGFEKGEFASSIKYTVYYDKIYNEYKFYSKDKENSDFETRVQNSTGIYAITDNLFAYGIANDGIYVIDGNTRQINKIINSTDNCIIDKVENNVIYYDNTSIELSYN